MGILDIKNIAEIGGRSGINMMTASCEGPLWELLGDNEHKDIKPMIEEDGTLRLDGHVNLYGHTNNCMAEYQRDGYINSIHCQLFSTRHVNEVDEKVVTPYVRCNDAEIQTCRVVRNVHFVIDGSDNRATYRFGGRLRQIARHTITFSCLWSGFHFENTEIEFQNMENSAEIRWYDDDLPQLAGLKSNCNVLNQHTNGDFPDEYFQLFDPDHKCTVVDTEKGCQTVIPIKSIKKVVSVANNDKRYQLIDHLIKLRNNAKLSDILNIEGLPQLGQVIVRNNNVALRFVHEDGPFASLHHFSRVPHTLSKNASMDELYPKTADGWYVMMTKF